MSMTDPLLRTVLINHFHNNYGHLEKLNDVTYLRGSVRAFTFRVCKINQAIAIPNINLFDNVLHAIPIHNSIHS